MEEDEGTISKSKKNPCLPSFAKQVYGRLLWRFGGAIGLWSKRHHKGNGLNGGCLSLALARPCKVTEVWRRAWRAALVMHPVHPFEKSCTFALRHR